MEGASNGDAQEQVEGFGIDLSIRATFDKGRVDFVVPDYGRPNNRSNLEQIGELGLFPSQRVAVTIDGDGLGIKESPTLSCGNLSEEGDLVAADQGYRPRCFWGAAFRRLDSVGGAIFLHFLSQRRPSRLGNPCRGPEVGGGVRVSRSKLGLSEKDDPY